MVGAHPRNAKKSAPVTTWFHSKFSTTASASVVNAANQSYNRVNEQFAHHNPHVIFVVPEPASVKRNVTTARKKSYASPQSDRQSVRTGKGWYISVDLGGRLRSMCALVTGVQTRALPIGWRASAQRKKERPGYDLVPFEVQHDC